MSMPIRDSATGARDPARKATVMIVDDAVVVRGLMSRWIGDHPGFEVVACTRNGRLALEELDRVSPDIIVLDLDMPELDGISALPLILKKCPTTAVLISSTLTRRNAELSLRCLALGAVDYVPKPESNREITTSLSFRQEIIGKLEALAQAQARRHHAPPHVAREALAREAMVREQQAREVRIRGEGPRVEPPRQSPVASRDEAIRMQACEANRVLTRVVTPRCLLIGASTGGPRAVSAVLSAAGAALAQLPVVIVQHMPAIFTSVFAEHLHAATGRPSREPIDGERLCAGTIYVAPGGRHFGLGLSNGHVTARLDDGPPVNFCKPSVDVAFRDAAEYFGASALAVILTGMGHDGLNGVRKLRERGATVIAQDEATSTVWGMPGCVARAGLAHAVLPLDAIGSAVTRLMSRGGAR